MWGFLRPQIPLPALMLKGGGIQRKGIEGRFYLAFFNPLTAERVAVGTFEDKHPVLEHPELVQVLRVSSGKIDIPFPVNFMQFRCPDELAHWAALRFTPDHHRRRFAQTFQRRRATNLQPVIFRNRGDKIVVILMAQNIGVRALFNKRIRPVAHQAFLMCSLVLRSCQVLSSS